MLDTGMITHSTGGRRNCKMNIDYNLREEMRRFPITGQSRATAYALYSFLLINANYESSDIIERGQILTSTPAISAATGLTEKQVRTAVDKLISAKLISKKSTKHYTIFTLMNYDRSGKRQQSKPISADDDSKSEADREYYEYLRREIRTRELNDEERRFFNSYYD